MHLLTKLIHTHTYRLIANAPYIAPPPHTHTRTGLANALYIAPPPPPPTHTHTYRLSQALETTYVVDKYAFTWKCLI